MVCPAAYRLIMSDKSAPTALRQRNQHHSPIPAPSAGLAGSIEEWLVLFNVHDLSAPDAAEMEAPLRSCAQKTDCLNARP
jgi:hypothetical protein